jgi:hypothetical protein
MTAVRRRAFQRERAIADRGLPKHVERRDTVYAIKQ